MDAAIYLRKDTIAAISTPSGRGAIAVIRLSGPETYHICQKIFKPTGLALLKHPRMMVHGQLLEAETQNPIDDILAVWFPAPKSYTGEDMAELHCHGSEAVLRKTLEVLYGLGARAAEPGEFTFRAVRSGKLDLAQAEAVGQLIDSRSQLARSMSLRMLEGAFSQDLQKLRQQLLQTVVEMETQIEFPDDAMEEELEKELQQQTTLLLELAVNLQQRAIREQRFEQGVMVVLAGRPNVGKSSLFNKLIGRERAIVTPHAGTTRDSLEGTIEIGGWPLTLIDTAGLRETQEEIEAIGIQRSRDLLSDSQLILFICEAFSGLTIEDIALLKELKKTSGKTHLLIVANKSDLGVNNQLNAQIQNTTPEAKLVYTSTIDDNGLDALMHLLKREVETWAPAETDSAFIVSARQEAVLANMVETINRTQTYAYESAPMELMAEELRTVLNMIAELDGTGIAPDIMNTIFSQFCIGK